MTSPILLFTQEFPAFAGGVATYCDRLARHLAAEDHDVVVVAPSYGRQDAHVDAAAPFEIIRYPESRFFLSRHFHRFNALVRAVRRHQPSLVWAADWRVGALVLPVSFMSRVPMAVTVYGSELLMARRRPWKRVVARWVYGRAVGVFAISSYVAGLLAEFGVEEASVHLVPLGVDTGLSGGMRSAAEVAELSPAIRRRHGLGNRRVLLTLARLTPRKGQDTAIEALAEVLKRRGDTVYLIAGTGPDETRLRGLAERLGVSEHVIFAGSVADDEKAAYYRACDIFVMLSRQDGCFVEGFGMTYLEAALEGKPVVGTTHGGVPEAVLDGETGLLVPPSDPVAAVEAILRLLDDAQLASRLGEAGRHRAREFTWQATAARSAAYLEPWLPHSSKPARTR
jgi:phosphatidyl-myo-inositol dimannoside synthase